MLSAPQRTTAPSAVPSTSSKHSQLHQHNNQAILDVDRAYEAAVTDDIAIFVDDIVDNPSVAMALTHSSVAVAMLSPARGGQLQKQQQQQQQLRVDDLEESFCFQTPPSKEVRPHHRVVVLNKTPPYKEEFGHNNNNSSSSSSSDHAGGADVADIGDPKHHFDRVATLRRFATDRTNTTAFGTPLRKPQQQQQMQHLPPMMNNHHDGNSFHHLQQQHPLLTSQQNQTPGRYYHNLSLAEQRRAPAPPPTPADYLGQQKAYQQHHDVATSPPPLGALLSASPSPSVRRRSSSNKNATAGGDSNASELEMRDDMIEELVAKVELLQKECARLSVMHEHQRSLVAEAETARSDIEGKLQAKIMEAIGLASRLDESKRYVRQLKKEGAEARVRTLAMANGNPVPGMLLSAIAAQQQQQQQAPPLDEAQLERLVEPRVRAAVRNAEMRYLAVVRDQQDRIQALEELLGAAEDPMAKLAEASLVRNKRLVEETAMATRAAAIARERMNAAVQELESKQREHDALAGHMQEQLRVSQRALASERDYVDELLSTLDLMKAEMEESQQQHQLSSMHGGGDDNDRENMGCKSAMLDEDEDEEDDCAAMMPPVPAPPPVGSAMVAPRPLPPL